MARQQDHYKTLGVAENASAQEIKSAYRQLARENHPDRNPDDAAAEERFKRIQEAYEVVGDQGERRRYDRARSSPFGSDYGGPFDTSTGGRFYRSQDVKYVRMDDGGFATDDGPLGGLGDLFGRMFGGEPEPRRSAVEPEMEVELTFDEMLSGGKAEVRLPDGRMVRVPYPRGVKPGYRVRLRTRGAGGHAAMLFVRFRIADHADFRREGNDLYSVIRVGLFEALLGADRSLTTPYGKTLKLTVPKGAQPGEHLRLRGQGLQTDEGTGDLFVEIRITVPRDLSPRDEEILRDAAGQAGLL
jgi:DnaJ-class molecular chaperone